MKPKPEPRQHPEVGFCGLCCGLCPRYQSQGASRCPGCGGPGFEEVHPTCAVRSCGLRHGVGEFCTDCGSYPCEKYQGPSPVDSFISYRTVGAVLTGLQEDLPGTLEVLRRKQEILEQLLKDFNDGRHKGFYCLLVNHAALDQLEDLAAQLEGLNPAEALGLCTAQAEAWEIPVQLRK